MKKIQPIFKEQIKMWSDLGFPIDIQEGFYWLDNGLIKAFTKDTLQLVKLYKYTVNNNLTISIDKHKDYKKSITHPFESWENTVKRHEDTLNKLECESIFLLQQYGFEADRIIVDTNSTGKDSEVKTHLAKKAGLNFKTYFNVTTLDVGDSTVMAKQSGYKFVLPDKKYGGFYQWIKRENIIPSRLNRCCCKYFKEDATILSFDKNEKYLFLFGMRNDESSNRSKYDDIWINKKWGDKRDWVGLLPIRKWSEIDVWLYIFREKIPINEKYKKGYPRVGCAIACPNYTKTTWVLDKYWYPVLFDRWRQILKEDFIKNNKWIVMNCTLQEYIEQAWNGGVFRATPTDKVVKEFSIHNNLELSVAKNYFNKHCCNGCLNKQGNPLKIKDKETLSMNMKFHGRNINRFKCKKCLEREFGWKEGEWDSIVKGFKAQGCVLF